jgi:hypothetical protein
MVDDDDVVSLFQQGSRCGRSSGNPIMVVEEKSCRGSPKPAQEEREEER